MSSHKISKENNQYSFSTRQEEILRLIAQCRSNQEISEILNISLPTVKTHICAIYRKIDSNYKNYGAQTLRLKTAIFGLKYFKNENILD